MLSMCFTIVNLKVIPSNIGFGIEGTSLSGENKY